MNLKKLRLTLNIIKYYCGYHFNEICIDNTTTQKSILVSGQMLKFLAVFTIESHFTNKLD